MKLKWVDLENAAGKILAHNVVNAAGQKVIPKGKRIDAETLARLQTLGYTRVWVAELAPEDVPEDEAARRLAEVVGGHGIQCSTLVVGRANLQTTLDGLLKVDVEALRRLNAIPGLVIATRPTHSVVRKGQTVATLKIVPYAIPQAEVEQAETLAREAGGILAVQPFQRLNVGVLLTGTAVSEERLRRVFGAAIQERLANLGATVVEERFVEEEPSILAAVIQSLIEQGVAMILIVGETSIVDVDDLIPRAVREAGGSVEAYGAPVDPGNMLMVSYVQEVPVVGAPGCIRSRNTNVIDLVLPRLVAGEHLTREDLIELGHGGLLA